MQISKQKRGTAWKDEAGNTIPFTHIKAVEKVNEDITFAVAQKAIGMSQKLIELKAFIKAQVAKAIEAFHAEYKGSKTEFKGNYTIDNFEGKIRIEIRMSNPISFDDLLIQEAKTVLHEFLSAEVTSKNDTIKQMVLDAFETTRGKMDVKKILSLQRYTDRINDERYSRAMALISQAQRRPEAATYYRVSVKDDEGRWQQIPLSIHDI